MNNTLDSSNYEIIRDESSESFAFLSERSEKQVSKIASNELLQVPSQGIKVYLRFKPENDCENKLQDETYSVVSQSTLYTTFPNVVKKSARNIKKLKNRDNSIISKKIKFTQIFDAHVSQEVIFNQSIKSDIANFVSGQNCTIITYGTTNSGKTYTLFGRDSDLGIIPRCIDFIFTNIDTTQTPKFKLVYGNKIVCCEDSGSTVTTIKPNKINISNDTQKCLGHESKMIHSIWLSFGEIYNEAVYDLLDENCATKDNRLKLVPDKDGTFVKGLRIVHVASALEAHQILTAAISKLRVAASSFNQHSSRSHAMFTIKLLSYCNNCSHDNAKVSSLNFYDLAGSGRLESNCENDQIFIESRYINRSLLALNRCIKIIAENHATRQSSEIIGPFRESCLTRLLQKSLCEKERITFLVHLNTNPTFLVESQNILGLVTYLRKFLGDNTKYSKKMEDSGTTSISRETSNWDVSSGYMKNIDESRTNEELYQQNETLMKELTALKSSMFERECEIRQEFADMYVNMIKEHDENWRIQMEDLDKEREKLLKISICQMENYYEEKLNNIALKCKRNESDDYKDITDNISEYCEQNCVLTINYLKDLIYQLRKDLENAVIEKNDCKFTLNLIEKELQMLKDTRNSMSVLQYSSYINSSINQSGNSVFLSSEMEKSKDLNSIDKHIIDKSCEIEELRKQLQEKNLKLKDFEYKLTVCETEKQELIEKLLNMEVILKESNINYIVTDYSTELRTSCIVEDNELSLLYTNIETTKAPKDFETIPKHKLSLLSESENYWNISETSIDKFDHNLFSSDSSKNDSGITSEGSKSENEGKTMMTYIHIQDKVKQLKTDYKLLTDVHHAYRSKIAELSKELESIKHFMSLMKESAIVNEHKLLEYEKQLSLNQEVQLLNKKQSSEDKSCQTNDVLDSNSEKHIMILQELNERLKNHECYDIQASKLFEKFIMESVSVENLIVNTPKINELENELMIKNNRIIELQGEILTVKREKSILNEINEKLNMLENKVRKFDEEKNELNICLNKKLRNEVCLEIKLKNLSNTIENRENEIVALRNELENVINENIIIKENAKKLGDEILKSAEKMSAIKEELLRSEEIRINLERIVENEIGNLRPRLLLSDKDVAYVNSILEEIECKQLELNRLKVQLKQQDQDMHDIKENRDIFVERYKLLIEKLQNGEEVQIYDDINITQNNSPLKNESLNHNEESKSENESMKLDIPNESNVIVVKPSVSNTSLSSITSIGSKITAKSSDMNNSQKKLKGLCSTQ